jgi:seryl-tRNA(Sec) selenium transferase
MSIYERLGVRPIINVAGAHTEYGGALIGKEMLEATNEAASQKGV